MFSHYNQSVVKGTVISLCLFLASADAIAAYSDQEFKALTTKKEAVVNEYREKEINQLQLLLKRSLPKNREANMHLRLAELYTDLYRFYFFKENEIWKNKIDGYLKLSIEDQKRKKRPSVDNGRSREYVKKALAVLERIPKLRKSYSKLDEVYYLLGFNYWEIGDKERALINFRNIAQKYPKSRYAVESHRYIADYYFGKRQFRLALRYYTLAVRDTDSPTRPRALYGLAWTYYKLKRYNDATRAMREAIDVSSKMGAEGKKPGVALYSDVYDALALFYSEGGNIDEAAAYFKQLLGEEQASEILEKLASKLQYQGKYGEALKVNKQLNRLGVTKKEDTNAQRFEILLDGINVAGQRNQRDREAQLIKALVAEFILEKNQVDKEQYEVIRRLVRNRALLAHQEGNSSKNAKAAFRRAADLYRLYLDAFGSNITDADRYEVQFFLADVYIQTRQNRKAALEYKTLLEAYDRDQGNATLKKLSKDSAAGFVYALDNSLKGKGKPSEKDVDELIAAVDTYTKLFPKEKDTVRFQGRAVGLLIQQNKMARAEPRMRQLIKEYPESKYAFEAAEKLIQYYEQQKQWNTVVEFGGELVRNDKLLARDKNKKFTNQLGKIISRAKFLAIQDSEQAKSGISKAQEFETLAKNSRDKEVREKSLKNALAIYQKNKDRTNELRVYYDLLGKNINDSKSLDAIISIANEYFLLGQYDQAASEFEKVYTISKGRKGIAKVAKDKFIESLNNAAFLRKALGQGDKAEEDFRLIIAEANSGNTKARDFAEEALWLRIERLRDAFQNEAAVKSLKLYISRFPNGTYVVEANYMLSQIYTTLLDNQAAARYRDAAAAKAKQAKSLSARERGFAAHARLDQLFAMERDFEAFQLKLPEKQLQKDIRSFLGKLDTLTTSYNSVIAIGDLAWAMEAFRRQALAYETFANRLERAPVPEEYDEETKAKFRSQLKQVAAPVREKIKDTLDRALQQGRKLNVTGDTMAKVYLMSAMFSARSERLPVIIEADWSLTPWLMGETGLSDEQVKTLREQLVQNSKDAKLLVDVGNWHAMNNQLEFAEIFYYRAISSNKNYIPALNNLAALAGRKKELQRAFSGFQRCLAIDEFSQKPKHNLARIFMASGLWQKANKAYRQLEVRKYKHKDIQSELGISQVALGNVQGAEEAIDKYEPSVSRNKQMARAALYLGQGKVDQARGEYESIRSESEYAALVLKHWK